MFLDLSGADLGHEFKIVGGRWDGERGHTLDYVHVSAEGEEIVDEFAEMTVNHIRTDLGPLAAYMPEPIWRRMATSFGV